MANKNWTGLAAAVAQKDTFTPADVAQNDVYTLTVTGLDGATLAISHTAADGVEATVAAALVALWNASTSALCTGITASGTATVILTADVAGTGFSVAATVSGTGTLSRAATIANAGPLDWSSVDNWSDSALPGAAAGDDVYIEDAEILYGLDQSGIGNTLASLNSLRTQLGSNPAEGRSVTYFQIKASIINIGLNTGLGSSTEVVPVNINTGDTASAIYIYNTGLNSTYPAVRIKANSASTTVTFKAGRLGLAYELGETCTIGTLTVEGGAVYAGTGLTITTINAKDGASIIRSAVTTINQSGGTLTTYGAGAVATANVSGGTFTSNSTGTITALNVTGTGIADFTKSRAARTVTTAKVDPGATISYDIETLTLTNKIQPVLTTGKITYKAT